jgi:hypothetical protein
MTFTKFKCTPPRLSLCHQKRGVLNLIEHPGNRPILQWVQASLLATNWFAAPPWSSLSQTLYRTRVMHIHESSNQIVFIHEMVVALIEKAKNSCFNYKKYRGWSPSIPSRSSTNQTTHTELGPLVSTPTLLLSQAWSLMQIAAALLATSAAEKSVTN